MSGRRLLLVSLIANMVLVVCCCFLWRDRHRATEMQILGNAEPTTNVITQTKLMPVYRKQFFSWSEIESTDYEQYIKNLREIGCPEQTIHDIIVADVSGLYMQKRMSAIGATNELPWWSTDFESVRGYDDATLKRLRELTVEQSLLLTRLLGDDWRASDKTFSVLSTIQFDGPLLGALSFQQRQAVVAIMGRAEAERISNRLFGIQSEQVERRELAGVLPPEQLEAFLLRYSINATSLREELGKLKYFNATQDEFRRMFRMLDGIDTQIGLLASSDDPSVSEKMRSLQNQRIAAFRASLSPERYAEFVRLNDPAYLEALSATLALGGKLELVKTLYSVNQQVAAEEARVQADTNLTDLQRQIELKKIDLTQLQAQAQAIGQLPIEPPKPELQPAPETLTITSVYSMLMGEDLKQISERFRIPVSAIRAANPNLDFDNLRPGDRILIPEPSVRQSIKPFGK